MIRPFATALLLALTAGTALAADEVVVYSERKEPLIQPLG